ncbi:unnamed protein product, partial [Brenthis ino]
MKTGLLYGIVASSKTRMRCVFCGVYIPKANKCIEEHTNGTKHKECIDQMAEHGIIYNNEELYCRPCDLHFGEEDSVASHLENDDHANWIATVDDLIEGEFINVISYMASESDEVTCEVCNCNMYCTLQIIEEHVNEIAHRNNVAEKLRPLNGIFPVENEDEMWCKVCDEYFENSAKGILQHIDESQTHVDWFMKLVNLIQAQDVSVQDFLRLEHEKNAYCNVCQMEVTCELQSIEEHVYSDAHLNQFS